MPAYEPKTQDAIIEGRPLIVTNKETGGKSDGLEMNLDLVKKVIKIAEESDISGLAV